MEWEPARRERATWEAMAPSFHQTRQRPWPLVETFLQGLPPGSRVLDLGCGNGRHLHVAEQIGLQGVGVDFSRHLLVLAQGGGGAFALGTFQGLPLRSRAVDHAMAVASVHHVQGRGQRLEVWRELRRVVRPSGRLMVTVWALEAPRFQPRPNEGFPGARPSADAMLAWGRGTEKVARFVHLYVQGELEQELSQAGWVVDRVERSGLGRPGTDRDNHVAWARAPPNQT